MPIYEYRCLDCQKRSSRLILNINSPPSVSCRYCQGKNLQRVLSRFASPKSEEARLEALADPGKYGNLDENDPQSMARFMKRMGQEMGEDFGDGLDEALDETRATEGDLGDTDLD